LLFFNDANLIVFRQTYLVIILVVFVKTTCSVVFTKTTSPQNGEPCRHPSLSAPEEQGLARWGRVKKNHMLFPISSDRQVSGGKSQIVEGQNP